jgi:hypothetical protein
MNVKGVITVRAIHYSIRYSVVLIMISLLYLSLAFLFHQTVQLPVIITLLFTAFCAERMWILLDWIGPVVGTMDRKKQEQDRKQTIEYLLENSLRYGAPLVIAAICGKKRISLHVVARLFRKSDIVLRSSAGNLLVLLPFTSLELSHVALQRLVTQRLPIRGVVATDVSMLEAFVEAQRTHDNGEASVTSVRDLRRICLRALDEKVAAIKSSSATANVPSIYRLFESGTAETLFGQLNQSNASASEMDVLSAALGESVTFDSR